MGQADRVMKQSRRVGSIEDIEKRYGLNRRYVHGLSNRKYHGLSNRRYVHGLSNRSMFI